jgi:hypothetical protein
MYRIGFGVQPDDVIAFMWFDLASAGGEEEAGECRDNVAANMTAAEIAEAQRLAREWKSSK